MKKALLIFSSLIALAIISWSCSQNVFTGRKTLTFIPEAELNSMSLQEYNTFLTQNKTIHSGSQVQTIQRIGNDLKAAIEVYYKANNDSKDLSNYKWEFNLVDDPKTVNAFCMPGGKVVVYSGLLPITQNDDALAMVMGHEIAHALSGHGNERMSQGLITQLGLQAVDLSLAMAQKPAATRQLFQSALGYGAQLGVTLPFSRKDEAEADEIGTYLAAMAGYNVNEGIALWQRMGALGGGSRPPEFLSTHPDPANRAIAIKNLIPKAMEYKAKYPVPLSSRYRRQ